MNIIKRGFFSKIADQRTRISQRTPAHPNPPPQIIGRTQIGAAH
jgi:hypothetical protein